MSNERCGKTWEPLTCETCGQPIGHHQHQCSKDRGHEEGHVCWVCGDLRPRTLAEVEAMPE